MIRPTRPTLAEVPLDDLSLMRKLVCQFYDGLNFGQFVRRHGDRKGLITDVLIGDLFKPDIDALWPLMDEMKDAPQPAPAGASS
jgi:hypothetical protein